MTHNLLPYHACSLHHIQSLTPLAMQVWLANCKPLNKMVAIKLMDLESFGANLVSHVVPRHKLCIAWHQAYFDACIISDQRCAAFKPQACSTIAQIRKDVME